MIGIRYFLDRIRDVKVKDYLSVFPMAAALIVKPLYKKKYRDTWLICEEPAEARDNGYHFFKYMCLEQKQQKCFYAIKRKSVDYKKAAELGAVIEYGSVSHWLAYFLCKYNISSQKGGKPNAALCAFMELNGRFRPRNIFLQHGVIKDDLEWLHSDRSCIEKFITSTVPEWEYVDRVYGYPKGTIQLTGLSRFDALHDIKIMANRIVIMPTWRYWFNLESKKAEGTDSDFQSSEYLQKWKELLTHSKLVQLIQKYGLDVIFYPHRNMQNHVKEFMEIDTPVTIASWEKYDVQDLLKTSAMMITDYSSVAFDMIYMKKPIIYYQFDEDKFRKFQYAKGYFDYHHNPFGNSFALCDGVLTELEKIIMDGIRPTEYFLQEHRRIFKYWDRDNSKRIYELLEYGTDFTKEPDYDRNINGGNE